MCNVWSNDELRMQSPDRHAVRVLKDDNNKDEEEEEEDEEGEKEMEEEKDIMMRRWWKNKNMTKDQEKQ